MKKYLSRLAAILFALLLTAVPASALSVEQALELLEEHYYYGLPEQAGSAQTVEELIQLLGDPYTEYMSRERYEQFLSSVEDTVDLVGIGVVIDGYSEEGILIETVMSGGGAQEAGLLAGDLIVAIDGQSCVPSTQEDRDRILGEEGSQVAVTVLREGQRLAFTITRRPIYIPNTEISLLEGGIGYIDCNSFGTDTAGLMAEGMAEFEDQAQCWILDLRDNTGGYVNSAIDMLAALNGPGGYLYFEDSAGLVTPYGTLDRAVSRKPLIVLVNEETASASELVSAGVRDTGRGVLIGSRTFGKGVAQSILSEDTDPEYFDGDCLKVTTARFYSAGGSTTDKIGVIPTLLVDDGYTAAVAAALTGGSAAASSLCVVPGVYPFYVNPDTPDEVLKVLLEALPPDIPLFYAGAPGATFQQAAPAQAAEKLGLEFESRWFSDAADSSYAAAIQIMGTYRLLNGTAPGVFSPEEPLTRAQLCVMLARVFNVDSDGPSQFSDVAGDAWYASGVNAMAELGLVGGVGDGKFDPNGALTQQQFLTIMGRAARFINVAMDAYGLEVEASLDALPLDMEHNLAAYADWAKGDVATLVWGPMDMMGARTGLMYTDLRQIDPAAPVLREEAAAGMYAVLGGLGILP